MNIYDKKPINCVKCGKFVGEIDYDAEVVRPLCGHCANPLPNGIDDLAYSIQRVKNMRDKALMYTAN